ncbi:bifunctional tetrahydrofolate synthase/dihydrofolate synthase [Echinimonas agarilytica]|uniref:Dihydrofolate synthase/folylpolyglutamate synthase n=1 Tax=Echinimonas agarilytica TaxID=1215918 RepID=A0AA41W5K1_9GAMM|nr:bifunctional tetrahydrofolate synthase/dihydrofolate synthase [Echinimonas agarilytica]MCM2679245.1 bifunctional tetrahydrofolate synthase/dihydrofolate synthase [Echinimonas agarilytica]
MTSPLSAGRSLDEWLAYLESIHPTEIELGLERVGSVADALSLRSLAPSKVILVAGTNGKGSTCCFIENCLLQAGYRVGVYSSPHICDYRERVRVNGQMQDAEAFCEAFCAVEEARGETSLSYFEFGTLAALLMLKRAQLDVAIVEVGLGGRLDATNVISPDVSVVTSVDYDHETFLGSDINIIGQEKAGVFRTGKPAILGSVDLPPTVLQHALDIDAQAWQLGRDFALHKAEDGLWAYRGRNQQWHSLPVPALPLTNLGTALATLDALQIDVAEDAIAKGVAAANLPGRWQVVQNAPLVVLDVAHNPQATRLLAEQIRTNKSQRVIGVVAMLSDKDSVNSLNPLKQIIDCWYVANLDVPRGAQASMLAESLSEQSPNICLNVETALRHALETAAEDDMVVVFGSFYTVAAALESLQRS